MLSDARHASSSITVAAIQFLGNNSVFLNFGELSFTTIQFLGSDSVYLNTFRIFEFRSMPFSFEKQQNLLHVLYITVDLQYLTLYYI